MTNRKQNGAKKHVDGGRVEPKGGLGGEWEFVEDLSTRPERSLIVFRNWQSKKIYMYVQIIIFLYMIISLKSRIYLTGWNERIGGKRVGAGRDLSRESGFSVHPSHWFSRILSLLSSFRSSRPPSYSRRRRDAETERQISRTFPKCAFDIPSPGLCGAHYSAALVISRAPLWNIIEN